MDESQSPRLYGLSRRLAEFTVSFRLEQAPAQALENAKLAILDCLGVSILAVSNEIGPVLLRFARENSSPGPCTVWGTEIKTTPREAALLNGTLAHGLDYDDSNHASTYTLASCLAAAESCGASGVTTLEAFIVGREVRMCLDGLFSRRSEGMGPGARGWHSNGILGPIASTCAVSKILGLDVTQALAAIGVAAGSCGALTRDGGTMAKPFRCGHAAASGLTCALLAKEGFTSDETPLEGPYGLLSALGPVEPALLQSLGRDLGREFNLASSGIRIKSFASCTATHSGVEAMLRLVQKRSIAPSEVDFIECDLHPYPLVRISPKRAFEGRFSMPFCLAVALVLGRLNPEDFSEERLQDRRVKSLMECTRHIAGAQTLVVGLRDGARITETIRPHQDLHGWDEVRQKFDRCAAKALSQTQRQAVIDMVTHLEEILLIEELTKALRGAH